MANLTKQSACDIVNSIIRDGCNSGISWGTNNYPADRAPNTPLVNNSSWFAGPTTGQPHSLNVNEMTFAGGVNAQSLLDTIHYFIGPFAAIRKARIFIGHKANRTGGYSGGWTTFGPLVTETLFDQTAVGNFNAAVTGYTGGITAGVTPTLSPATTVTEAGLRAYCTKMLAQYNALCRDAAAIQLSIVGCHSSCHRSCYASRSRR